MLLALLVCTVLAVSSARPDSAEDNFSAYCTRCHGENGRGDGPSVHTLKNKPQDFTNCAQTQKLSDQMMFQAIKGGGSSVGLSGDMPNWNIDLTDDEIHDLVAFIRTFCKKK